MSARAEDRRSAIEDAIAFRLERYRMFPDAADEEWALEINEGVPEYTGVKLALATPQARRDYAIRDLNAFTDAPTFVRSFAYATGPAYGLLLDKVDPDWLYKIGSEGRFDQLLSTALGMDTPDAETLDNRTARYDDGALLQIEKVRDREKSARLAEYKAKLVDGPVLILPLFESNFQFNPQTLVPLEGYGRIFPTLGLTDRWGSLQVEDPGSTLSLADGTPVFEHALMGKLIISAGFLSEQRRWFLLKCVGRRWPRRRGWCAASCSALSNLYHVLYSLNPTGVLFL